MMESGLLGGVLCGFICLWAILIEVVLMFKHGKLFTPLLPSVIVEFAFSLYLMKLVVSYEDLPYIAMVLIVACMFVWKLITISNNAFRAEGVFYDSESIEYSHGNFELIISLLFIVAVTAILFEWWMAGGIPALRADSETFRFNAKYNSITHLLAIMNKVIAMLIGIFLVNKEKISLKKDWILIFELIISELLMVGTAMRGEMIMAPAIIFIFYATRHRIKARYFTIAGIAAFFIIGIVPYIRSYSAYGVSYIVGQKSISRYPEYYMFTPLYQSFADNFNILNLDLSIFPLNYGFGLGDFSVLPLIPFVDLGKSLMNIQNAALNMNFYGGLTATFFASWYADFGYIGFFIVTVIYAVIVNWAYKLCLRKGDLLSFVIYSYTLYSCLWIFYNGVLDSVYIVYCMLIWLVFRIKIKI